MLAALASPLTQEPGITRLLVQAIIGVILSIAGLAFWSALMWLLFDQLIAPLRIKERTLLFLQLIETSAHHGQSIERRMVALSETSETGLGPRFQSVAAYLRKGMSLGTSLESEPRFLPREVVAMLKVGESIGNLTKVLPACRRVMEQAASKSQTAVNSSVIILLVWPVAPFILWILSVFVLPKLMNIAADFETPMPAWIGTLSNTSFAMTFVIVGLWLLILFLGMRIPGRTGFIPTGFRPWADRFDLRLPWRRHRMERDFSSMLAILLDAEVPEAKAVQMAAEGTGNNVFIARAKSVLADLQNGVELCKALKRMDASGEFEWRLRNASFPPEGFQSALAGWHESLEAKAFQQEQTFSQAVTTTFILLNGMMVGMSAMSVFAFIIAITEDVALW